MQSKIFISSVINQMLVGVVEDGRLAEVYIERDNQQKTVGNVYKGRVENVLPGMSAAFVDIGLDRNAFLYVDDINGSSSKQSIKDILRRGQEVIVQVVKEPVGTKGARVISQVSLAGRFLVLLPHESHLGISRQIRQAEERDRLRELAAEHCPPGFGLIVRTVAEGCQAAELVNDLSTLVRQWRRIKSKARRAGAPSLLYRDYDLVYRTVRDLVTDAVDEIVVDQRSLKHRIKEMLDSLQVPKQPKVRFHKGSVLLFEEYGLDKALERSAKRQVWLDCGGYLVFDPTEALTAIDVNTGKYIGSKDLETTVLKTNLEAADEIARQLRLRNIGGIVIIDFIDMETSAHRTEVLKRLEAALATDKVRTHVLGFTQLGLVELSRKKSKTPLASILQKPCPQCQGSGQVLSHETLALRAAQRVFSLAREDDVEAVLVVCNPLVASFLIGLGGSNLRTLEKDAGISVFVRGDEALECDDIRYHSGSLDAVSKQTAPVAVGQDVTVEVDSVHTNNPRHGIAKVSGFVIDIVDGADYVGLKIPVVIREVHKTFAVAEKK